MWARAKGHATFNFSILDVIADLQLGFRLVSPTDAHLQEQVHYPPPVKRKKSTARLVKDRARAADHQARMQSKDAAASPSTSAEESPKDVILPFSGKYKVNLLLCHSQLG